jgi:protein-tyrosine phosphatase
MINANNDFASHFTPEVRKFIDVLLSSDGKPVLFHCTAGKDRTGFAAAVLLRILGVPHDVVVEDYLLTNRYFLASHRWNLILLRLLRGAQFAEIVRGFMLARHEYLFAAFETIDSTHGSFDHYYEMDWV